MQLLIVATMITALTFQYLSSQNWIPHTLTYVPELLAAIVAALVVILGVRNRFQYVRPAYWMVFGALVIVMVCGILANRVEAGPVFAGLRHYLRALPFFLLPAVFLIKERALRFQLLLLLVICLVQSPIAWDQRQETMARENFSGDWAFGTLMQTKSLSLLVICGACFLTAFYLRQRISLKLYLPLLLALLFPTMLNETKGSLIITPIALLATFLVAAKPGARLKNSILATAAVATFVAVFVPVYDHFMQPRWGYGIVDFFTMEGRVEGYLDRGAELGTHGVNPGKLGALRLAVDEVMRDPVWLAFGVGIGNASESALGDQFTGRYYALYGFFIETTLVQLLVEWGLIGLMLVVLLYWLVFRDCVAVARSDRSVMGVLALGMGGAVVAMFVAITWHRPNTSIALSALFWYFSGLVAAHRMRMAVVEDTGGRRSVRLPAAANRPKAHVNAAA